MDKKSLERYRKLLIDRRQVLQEASSKNRDMRSEAENETAADMADMAANAYTKEFLYSLSNSERENLDAIEGALARMDSKDYGECVECEEKLNKKRLDAIPWALYCVSCQELAESGRLRS